MQVALILIPTVIYGFMFLDQEFPKTERVEAGTSFGEMVAACTAPLFLFMAFCMFLTANTELSTGQWVDKLLGNADANPLLILALVNTIMAMGRYFGEPIIHKLNPVGILLISAVLSAAGLYLLRNTEGNTLYLAATLFALGVCYFWPTMLGFVNENLPKSGALGLSLMGGVGMLGNWAYQSFLIGPKLDAEKANGLSELAAGRSVLGSINLLPVILIVAFGLLYFYMRSGSLKKV
jgi:fucose permease